MACTSIGAASIIITLYGVIGRHLSCHIRNAVFSFQLLTLKKQMITEGKKRYEHPRMNVINLEIAQMIATSGDVTVGGWGDGGSLGGGEAEESASRRGEWGNLWYNN